MAGSMRAVVRALALVACVTVVGWSAIAEAAEKVGADEPSPSPSRTSVLQPGWHLSTFAGYGADTGVGGDAAPVGNPFAWGVGARARNITSYGMLFGVRLSHHFGSADSKSQLSTALLELGLALPLGPVRAEVYGDAGLSRIASSSELCDVSTGECTKQNTSSQQATYGLGVTVAYPFYERYFASVSAETLAMMGPAVGVLGYGGLGVTF